MKKATFYKYELVFKTPGGTSRGVLKRKETYILEIEESDKKGVGECALFKGLSCDDVPNYEENLIWLCENINEPYHFLKEKLRNFPSIWIGYEQACLNLQYSNDIYFPSRFVAEKDFIRINGLIWMGNTDSMKMQIEEKLNLGFRCIKLKIGTNWDEEYEILKVLRSKYSEIDLQIRVDANGAFSFEKAKKVLDNLSSLKVHSIEQPIKSGQFDNMAELCKETPTPIALDEELIGLNTYVKKQDVLTFIKPQFIILKPSLVGGFSGTDEWIELADSLEIGWWITSALESNIGLNAICQYTYTKNVTQPQGLGTGGLFTNNFESSLELKSERIYFRNNNYS